MLLNQKQVQVQLSRLIMVISKNDNLIYKAYKEFHIEDAVLKKLPKIDKFEDFVKLANKYRNVFRNNFQNDSFVPYEESLTFFSNLDSDPSRALYAISIKNDWIGHFGLKLFDSKTVLLDNALRFSNKGSKDLFRKINLFFIDFILNFDSSLRIAIIIERNNLMARRLQKGLNVIEGSLEEYQNLGVDLKRFSLQFYSKD